MMIGLIGGAKPVAKTDEARIDEVAAMDLCAVLRPLAADEVLSARAGG